MRGADPLGLGHRAKLGGIKMIITFREDIDRLGCLQRAKINRRLVSRRLPENGKVRGYVIDARPAGGGLRGTYVEWKMQLEEHEGFDPKKPGPEGGRPFYHIETPISTSDPRLQRKDMYTEVTFTCVDAFRPNVDAGPGDSDPRLQGNRVAHGTCQGWSHSS